MGSEGLPPLEVDAGFKGFPVLGLKKRPPSFKERGGIGGGKRRVPLPLNSHERKGAENGRLR